MKNNNLITVLKDLGLSDNEAGVYLAALSLGSTTILKIARAANQKRTTVYSVIESLKQKGLMFEELKGWKKLFTAESPEKLEKVLEQKRHNFQQLLPNFLALYNLKGSDSLIKYYQGLEAIKGIYTSILDEIQAHDDYLVIGAQDQWYDLDPKFFDNFIRKRAKLSINIRLLFTDSPIARKHKNVEKIYNEKIKILPKNTQLTTNLVITPKKIIIHQLMPPIIAMVIENPSIVQMHRELFEVIWKSIR
ncbi:MAG: hypothetical protein M1338_02345 [Patescibacteria group bacterium]|nr:hypothetical protein [Patescibacteria group bacterium]